MTYIDSLEYINSFLKFGINPGLDRVKKLLSLIGNPQDKLKFVHVAGTNGKGSICNFTSCILQAAGYKTGLFTSPFVLDFRERIQINGIPIRKSGLAASVNYVKPFADQMLKNGEILTEFEIITAIAMQWFYSQNCDIVVLEVGLGGRFDATNVINTALLSVITSISLDHTNILGNSIEAITREKCGIIKKYTPVIIYPDQPLAVIDIIKDYAKINICNVIIPNKKSVSVFVSNEFRSVFIYKKDTYEINLAGNHQITNAITAIEIINELNFKGFTISGSAIKQGLKNTKFAARLELISKDPIVLLDGTHNPGGSKTLFNYLNENFKDKKLIAIAGMLKDKDVNLVLKTILPCFSKVIVTSPLSPRAISEEELSKIAQKYCFNVVSAQNYTDAVIKAKSEISNFDGLVVFGSLYLAGNIRPILLKYFN